MTTRLLWVGAAVAAVFLLAVGAQRLADDGDTTPTTVLVAKQLIPAGTPGGRVLARGMYVPETVPRWQVEVGAIADPRYLCGRVAATDLVPGEKLTATSFVGQRTPLVVRNPSCPVGNG